MRAATSSLRSSPIKTSAKRSRRTAVRAQFDLGYHTKHVDTIFKRVFGES